MYITYLLGFIFVTNVYKYVKLRSGKKQVFLTLVRERSGNSQGILIDVLSINPDCVPHYGHTILRLISTRRISLRIRCEMDLSMRSWFFEIS